MVKVTRRRVLDLQDIKSKESVMFCKPLKATLKHRNLPHLHICLEIGLLK